MKHSIEGNLDYYLGFLGFAFMRNSYFKLFVRKYLFILLMIYFFYCISMKFY